MGPAGPAGARGPVGPAGPPGPGIPTDLATIVDLSWPANRLIDPQTAVQSLQSLVFVFSKPLDVGQLSVQELELVWVRYMVQSRTAATPMHGLRGRMFVEGPQVVWRLTDDPSIALKMLSIGAQVLIDLDCNYLFDTDGQPVSGSAGALIGRKESIWPGGIFRTWMTVAG